MGNIPAKITGKYQSYDITTSNQPPPLVLKRAEPPAHQQMNYYPSQPVENQQKRYNDDVEHEEKDSFKNIMYQQQRNISEKEHIDQNEQRLSYIQGKLEESIYNTNHVSNRDSQVNEGSVDAMPDDLDTKRIDHQRQMDEDETSQGNFI